MNGRKTSPVLKNVILERLTILFVARGPLEWTARLLLWCCVSFLLHVLVKLAFAHDVDLAWDFILVTTTALPLYGIAMGLVRLQVGSLADMTRIALTDELTGLMNRRAFFEAVEGSEQGALLIIDIDHFKLVNDRYGHAAGDAVLRAMGDHLRRNIRTTDLLGRIGGEEFALYLFGADSLEVDAIGARICNGFVFYNHEVPSPIRVTMSIGAAYAAMSEGLTELYRNADEALYAAKRSGRARLNFWQPAVSGRS